MRQNGQALILLIIAAAVTITVISTAILTAVGQARSSILAESGSRVYFAVESGSDQAITKLMRTPYACPMDESFTQDSINISIEYLPYSGFCLVTSEAQKDNIIKKIQFLAGYDNNPGSNYRQFNICCWKEVP